MAKISLERGYRPDYIPYQAPEGSLIECKNLLPYDNVYASMPEGVNYSSTAINYAVNGVEFRDNTGVYRQFIGTKLKLYRLETAKTWTDITKSGAQYDPGENSWNFCQYGEWVIATNYSDAPQVLKGLTTANFVDLGGSPPNGKFILLHSGHLIFGNLNESGTAYPKRLRWSAKEDIEDYTVSLTTGSDFQDLYDSNSDITGLGTAGQGFIIGHENCISVGWYMGAPFTFRFEQAKFKHIGCIPNSMVSNGSEVFFFDDHDVYRTDGVSMVSIGDGIREQMCEHIHRSYFYRITSGVDPLKNIIYWLVPTTESEGTPNRMYCYNWKTDRWSHVDIEKECIFPIHGGSGDEAPVMDSYNKKIDSVDAYVDSVMWLANAPQLACMDTTGYLQTFNGEAMTGTIETVEFSDGNINLLRRIRPLINMNFGTITGKGGYRFQEDDLLSYTDTVEISEWGYIDVFATGRYLRVNVNTTAHDGVPLVMEMDVVKTGAM